MEDTLVTESYIKQLEGLIAFMSQITYDEVSNTLEELENDILVFLHDKFPNMSVSKEELHNIIIKIYQTKNFTLKKEVECNLGKAKFNFEDKKQNPEVIIKEEIEKLKKLFTSVKSGTNYCYLGLVDKCTQEILGMLIRWHNSIAFSKQSENTKEYIRVLIERNYKLIMNNMGEQLLIKVVNPLEQQFNFNKEKVIVKQ